MSITTIIVLIMIFFVAYITYSKLKLATKKSNIQGERTIFEIDITDKGYEFYKNRIDKWINDIGFIKGKTKNNDRFLTYYKNGEIFTFGFNYYQKENKIIIEAWFPFLSTECPLKGSLYEQETEEDYREIKENYSVGEHPIAIFEKYEYIELLKSLINMPEMIEEKNEVTLLTNIDTSDIKVKLKKQKSTTISFLVKLIMIVILPGIILALIGLWVEYANEPKLSTEDQKEALEIIQNTHSSFELTESSHYVTNGSLVYTYYGTMKTPKNENDKVVIFMTRSNDVFMKKINDGEWAGEIRQNQAYGEKWYFNFEE